MKCVEIRIWGGGETRYRSLIFQTGPEPGPLNVDMGVAGGGRCPDLRRDAKTMSPMYGNGGDAWRAVAASRWRAAGSLA